MKNELQLPTKWGGRAGRYAHHKGKVLRIRDPISNTPQQFSQDFIYEAWLVHRFNPAVTDIKVGHFHLGDQPHPYQSCIQLDVSYQDGSRLIESLSKYPVTQGQIAQLSLVAKAMGTEWRARSRAEVRAFPSLLRNLADLRQLMQMHQEARDFQALKEAVTTADRLSRGDLDDLVRCEEPAFIDAGLGFLLHAGVIEMDIKEAAYGHGTRIARR